MPKTWKEFVAEAGGDFKAASAAYKAAGGRMSKETDEIEVDVSMEGFGGF